MKIFTTLVVVLLAIGCTQAPQTDQEGLKAMRDVWQSAFDNRDSATLAAIYAEDGALMPPNSDTLIGRAAIEAFWADFQASGIGGEIKDTEVYAHGDDGYTVGAYTVTDAGGYEQNQEQNQAELMQGQQDILAAINALNCCTSGGVADLNDDGIVDLLDYALFQQAFGSTN